MIWSGEITKFIKELDERIVTIWNRPPPELDKLRESMGPYCQSFTMVIYAYWNTNALAGELWVLRKCAKKDLLIDCIVEITKAVIVNNIPSFEAFGLSSTAELLSEASKVIAGIKNKEEYVEIVSRLIVYLNKLGMAGWLDLLIPWQHLARAYEAASR